MPEVRIPAYAKINLRLDILGKRADGFHELRTIFQTISLHDELRLRTSRQPAISLRILGNESLLREPVEKNLAYRAVDALRRELKIRGGVEIELKKKIPAGRGLGGGSSDAAAALLGYLRLTGKKIRQARLLEIAASARTCPFFCWAAGRWERTRATKFIRCRTSPNCMCSSFPPKTFMCPRVTHTVG